MTITKSPKRNAGTAPQDRQAAAYIARAEQAREVRANKILTPVRFAPDMLARIDRAARRLGISRSAFINSSTAEKLERMEA